MCATRSLHSQGCDQRSCAAAGLARGKELGYGMVSRPIHYEARGQLRIPFHCCVSVLGTRGMLDMLLVAWRAHAAGELWSCRMPPRVQLLRPPSSISAASAPNPACTHRIVSDAELCATGPLGRVGAVPVLRGRRLSRRRLHAEQPAEPDNLCRSAGLGTGAPSQMLPITMCHPQPALRTVLLDRQKRFLEASHLADYVCGHTSF